MAQDKRREREAMRQVGLDPSFVNVGGAGQAHFNPQTGQLRSSIDPRIAQFQDQQLGASSQAQAQADALRGGQVELGQEASSVAQGLFGELRDLSTGDPLNIAEEQFNRMESILAPARERRRSQLEGRLHSQGRLGGTGGAQELSELEGQFERDRQSFLTDQFQSANQLQLQRRGLAGQQAVQTGMFGADIQSTQAQQAIQSGQTGTNVANLATQMARLAPELANQLLSGEMSALDAVQAYNRKNQKLGTGTSRAFGVGGAILGGGIAAATGRDPLAGAQAGAQIGSGVGGFF